MSNFLFNITKMKIISISITHPRSFYCGMTITNNNLWVLLDIIWSTIIGHFFNVILLASNRVNNTAALFKMRSTIEIQKSRSSGLGKFLKLSGYSIGLTYFTWTQ